MELEKLKSVIAHIRSASTQTQERIPPGLNDRIASIKKAFQDYWRTEYLPLAARIAKTIDEGIPTPVLTVCGKGTREIRFTKYLAYFMDPQKDHGLRSMLLQSVFEEEARDSGLPDGWADNCIVMPEYWMGNYTTKSGETKGCFCDIGIVGNDFVFVIEQKILSGEGPAGRTGLTQLQRYSKVIGKNPEFKDKIVIKIYLTPSGQKKEGDNWLPLSHLALIRRAWQRLADANISETAKGNLRRLLIDLYLGPYTETEEIIAEMKDAAVCITKDPVTLKEVVRFRRLIGYNQVLVNLLLEGSL